MRYRIEKHWNSGDGQWVYAASYLAPRAPWYRRLFNLPPVWEHIMYQGSVVFSTETEAREAITSHKTHLVAMAPEYTEVI